MKTLKCMDVVWVLLAETLSLVLCVTESPIKLQVTTYTYTPLKTDMKGLLWQELGKLKLQLTLKRSRYKVSWLIPGLWQLYHSSTSGVGCCRLTLDSKEPHPVWCFFNPCGLVVSPKISDKQEWIVHEINKNIFAVLFVQNTSLKCCPLYHV